MVKQNKKKTRRTEEMRADARLFISEVAQLPYKEGGDGLLKITSAALRFDSGRERRRQLHTKSIA